MQEGFDQFGHGGFVAELGRVAFYGAKAQVIHDPVGQSCLADAGGAIEEGGYGFTGSITGPFARSPGHQSIVVALMEKGGEGFRCNGHPY
jgi:hypothetical protein